MTVRIIDIETTGVDPAVDKVIEIASFDLTRDLAIANEKAALVNPGIPIPPLSSAVHHLIDEDVADALSFDLAIADFMGADAYVAHNAKFEQSFIGPALGNPPFVCTFKAALRVWPELPSHSNQFLRYHLGLARPFGFARTELAAHRAASDVIVTAAILVKLMQATTWAQMAAWSIQPALFTKLTFGKHQGQRYDAVDPSYLRWITEQPDMDADKKFSAQHWLSNGRKAA